MSQEPTEYHFADRALAVPPNVFAAMDETVAHEKARRAAQGLPDVIDLSKANPDLAAPRYIIEAGQKATDVLANHRYTPFDGKTGFLEAAEAWYRREQGVETNWKTQIIATVGAIDGLSTLTQVLLNPGDVIAVPDPYYPPYEALAKVAGAKLVPLPAPRETGFLPDLDAISDDVWRSTRVLLLNYPNNPTGALATRDFYERIVELAHRFGFLIVNDFAYAGLDNGLDEADSGNDDDNDGGSSPTSRPLSLLSVAGSEDVAIEVVSLSKMYAMAGWRLGFVVTPAAVMARVRDYHHQMRSFPTGSVQDAGQVALESDQSSVREISRTYQRRRAILNEGLSNAGFDVFDTTGALFVWAGIPSGWDTDDFARTLLEHTGVAVMPGTCFGEGGRGYVRLSLLESEENLRAAAQRFVSSDELRTILGS